VGPGLGLAVVEGPDEEVDEGLVDMILTTLKVPVDDFKRQRVGA
jgi:hypothetical protein